MKYTKKTQEEKAAVKEARRAKKAAEMIGKKFGRLTVTSLDSVEMGRYYYLCNCECGQETIVRGTDLTSKDTVSCGCAQKESGTKNGAKTLIDLTGKTFHELTVISRAPNKGNRPCWNCVCTCGRKVVVRARDLKNFHTKACGHLKTVSKSEKAFLDQLETVIGHKIERQFCIHTGMTGRRYYDGRIVGTKTLIEVDGSHWHGEEQKQNDDFKDSIAAQEGYKLIRVKVDNVAEVDDAIKNFNVYSLKAA